MVMGELTQEAEVLVIGFDLLIQCGHSVHDSLHKIIRCLVRFEMIRKTRTIELRK